MKYNIMTRNEIAILMYAERVLDVDHESSDPAHQGYFTATNVDDQFRQAMIELVRHDYISRIVIRSDSGEQITAHRITAKGINRLRQFDNDTPSYEELMQREYTRPKIRIR